MIGFSLFLLRDLSINQSASSAPDCAMNSQSEIEGVAIRRWEFPKRKKISPMLTHPKHVIGLFLSDVKKVVICHLPPFEHVLLLLPSSL